MARSSLRTISGCGLLLVLLVAPWADGRAATPSLEGKRGGTLVQLGGSDVDFVDPGMTYYTGGYQLAYPTHRPLYSFKPGQVDPVPDLAEGAPEISPDAKTVTVRLRSGVRFSPPVNREVTSDDVKYAFERFMSKQVGGQYPSYFEVIVGTPASYTDRAKNISGIQTPDARTIVFKLKRAAGTAFASSLVLPITMPVPRDYAKPFDAKNPSTYNTHVVATGPYMVKNDAQGNLTGYKAGRSIAIVRNPNWDAATDYKPAYLDAINWTTNAADANAGDETRAERLTHVPRRASAGKRAQGRDDQSRRSVAAGLVGRLALLPDEHDDQAAGQPQRPQGDHRGVQPRCRPQGARRCARR